ncbi:hypothetical protein PACTADRAFT_50346 [Pachysolen tannophilus NRRL Y-2460]|uniref:Myb-like domain-containing protein n=1 Tax=Pachysolen tannophilus NRRL Y-2460 TaxID=669874 RepID=A0A1E4TVG3_PACTA|nr:hypothetical protein PACTADRAFT_50346 [Pachysolen tannophilus NRRL Y-2460]
MKLYEKCYKISQNRDKPYNEEQQEKLMHFSILNILKLRDYIQLLDGLEYCLTEIYPQIHGYWIPLDEARKMFEKMDYNADIVTTEEAFDKFLKLGKFSNSKEISLNVDIVSPPLQNSNDKKKGTVLSRDLKDVETSKVNGIGASIIALNPITLVERHEWSKDELIVLFESIEKYGLNYEKISDIFKSNNHRRSPSALRSFIESPDNESFPELKMLFGNANSTYNSKDWFASVKKLISSLFKIDSETGDESNRMNYSRRASLQEIKKQALTLRSNSSNRSLFPHWAETAASADENCNSKSERKTSGFKRSTSLKRSDHFWVTIDLKKTSFKFNGTNNDNSNLLVQDAQEISDKLVISETQAQAPTQSSISIDSIENLAAVLKKASAENLTTLKNFEEMCERIYLNCADDKVKQVMEDEVFKFWRPVFKKIKYQADSGFSNKNKQELKENKKLKKKQKHKEKKRKKQKNKSLYKRLKLNDIGNTQKIVIELISKSNDTSFEVMNISERLDGNSSKSNGDSDYNSTN